MGTDWPQPRRGRILAGDFDEDAGALGFGEEAEVRSDAVGRGEGFDSGDRRRVGGEGHLPRFYNECKRGPVARGLKRATNGHEWTPMRSNECGERAGVGKAAGEGAGIVSLGGIHRWSTTFGPIFQAACGNFAAPAVIFATIGITSGIKERLISCSAGFSDAEAHFETTRRG